MSSSPRRRQAAAASPASPAEALVWVFFAVAVMATLYCLMREPEETSSAEAVALAERSLAGIKLLALAAAAAGTAVGLWELLRRGGGQNLFAMAVLFNIILVCFWVLRLTLVPPA